ncbi:MULTISPECIES: glycoside hydrolase family 108 protein [unclassified Methylobacterium]|uniref:glycoside hydrolase family 108 protein n=1 Tax=unclassified Methylobacterium TaxID=2615210 RepID=UPI000CA9DF90|nr:MULTISPECIES: glycoside hydrolase family 108 protein [unclassified Methylobacterium]PIU06644.1 MAG: N-acetylmuramidase [Methylobacterium sp. CG09_land_8_20_14_0_10_71_15]PIU12096.1 MAG: N-acetylmuramidase [Methylobacterium sp. CG08_land_8_20_14_0_20_71_15]GBU19676.1 hypothetical protein AwMethylo_38910 [Methylobacterium sp.]
MSAERYNEALKRVLVHEGGYVNDPRDPGGATMKGVTQRTYDGYRKRLGLPSRPVSQITSAEVGEIYRRQYWAAVRGDELPAGIDYVLFDGAVNSGPVQSIKWLQRALGVSVDGVLGEATVAAAEAYPDHDALVAAILARRLAFLRSLKTWGAFGKGWGRRVAEVQAIGQAWATGSVGPQPTYVAGMERRGLLSDARTVPGRGFADATTGGGVISAAISQVTDLLNPLADKLPQVSTALTVLTAVGAVLAAAGIAYRLWANSRQKALDDALDRTPVAANDNAAAAAEAEPEPPAPEQRAAA